MKYIFRISILINVIVCCYFLIQFFSVQTYKRITTRENAEESPVSVKSISAAANSSVATCDTILIVHKIDENSGQKEECREKIPQSWIGKTREDISKLILLYSQNVSLEDKQLGFVSMELTSFSSEKIEVNKLYKLQSPYCCIVVSYGCLTVMDAKKENILFKTNISLYALNEDLKKEVMDGKYMYSQQELYNFLESYSS